MPFNFETFGTPVKETKAVKTAEKKTEPVKKVAGKFDFDSFGVEATPETQPTQESGIKTFAKSLVSAPLTLAARPFQLGAELLGASAEDVNKVSKKISGGFIAPVPENFKDVKKDVGRAVQTVAMGAAGPVSAGAGLGFGASLEQGNDVFSSDTLKSTAGGIVAGKVLGMASKPIGKVLDKVTPNIVKKGFGAVAKPITEFAERTKIMPEVASNVINNGARMTENALNKPFDVVGGAVKNAFTSSPEKVVQKRANTLQRLEDSNTRVRNYVDKQRGKGFDPKKDAYTTDLLVDSVDNNGVIRTKQENGAVARYNEAIRDKEGVVGEAIKREGRTVPLKDVEKELITAVNNSGVKGASRTEALSKVSREIEGYKMELDPTGTKTIDQIDMPVFNVHGAKVDKYANVNYLNENGRVDKAIAKTLKKIVEKNTSSVDVAALNREMSGHYSNIGYLEKLDGTRVEGGRLGKHFARTVGAIVGSHFGPLGAIAGSELAGGIKGLEMSGTFGKSLGKEVVDSPLMQKTIASQKFTPVKVKSVGGTNQIPTKLPGFRKLPVKEVPSDYTERFYTPDKKLPVIDAGKTPKVKSDLPVAKGSPQVFSQKSEIPENDKVVDFVKKWTRYDNMLNKGSKNLSTYDRLKNELTPEIEKSLSKYKPTEPIELYRFQRKGVDTPKVSSWSKDKEWVMDMSEMDDMVFMKKTFAPDDILVDIEKIPSNEQLTDIGEVIVKNQSNSFGKRNAIQTNASNSSIPKSISDQSANVNHEVIYHTSDDIFKNGVPEFDAYYGTKDWIKAFPNEFGKNTYKLNLPSNTKIVNLNTESPEAFKFMSDVAKRVYPDDKEFAQLLSKGDKDAIRDFYEIWTDKQSIMPLIREMKVDGARFQDELLLTKEAIGSLAPKVAKKSNFGKK